MKSNRHSIWAAGLGLLAAGLLTSCGGDGASGTDDNAQDSTSQSATDDSSTEQIATTQSDLGTFLVDEEGKTLYMFTQDSPGTSVCEGDCLAAWPALPGEVMAGEGVDQSLLGTIERSDGSTQVTYADWPLYHFAQDKAAGDVNGQGVNDVWYVLSPEGEVVKKAPGTRNGGY